MENPVTEAIVTQEIAMPGNEDTQLEKEKNEITTPNVDILFSEVHKWK